MSGLLLVQSRIMCKLTAISRVIKGRLIVVDLNPSHRSHCLIATKFGVPMDYSPVAVDRVQKYRGVSGLFSSRLE